MEGLGLTMKVVIATPTLSQPYPAYVDALKSSVAAMEAAGIEHQTVFEVGCPYISHARATMLRKALDAKADAVVFIDHDLSWRAHNLVRLITTDGSEVTWFVTVLTARLIYRAVSTGA